MNPTLVLYLNGVVLTMDQAGTTAQAVATRGDRIAAVGTNAAIGKLRTSQARVVDLKGRTMLPGFYAAHDHFPQSGIVALFQVDLNSPPIGPINNIAHLVRALRDKAAATPAGQWVLGRGYDDTLLAEKRHPTRADLDRVSTAHPVWIVHTSGHLAVANSMALALAGIDRATKDPPGGVYRRDGSGEPTGVIEEAMGRVTRLIPPTTLEQRQQAARAAERDYIAKGVTTTVVAGGSRQEYPGVRLRIHQMLSPGNKLPPPPATVKLFQDGSIQGLTGFLSAPYHSPAGQPARGDYRGYPARPRDSLAKTVRDLHVGGYQIAIHGNGDAAIDDILAAFEAAQREFPRPDSRHRIEHCQTAREDQLDTMRRLGVTPSFFVGHVYYWGDRHRDLFLGPARAARISPLASAARRGIRYTIHNDTPVTPVDPLLLVWCAVNRRTRGGDVLGPDQRVPVADALRSVTIDAAWQNFQERERGSIEVGKLADLVLLGENPLTVAPDRIKDIAVDEVVIGGVKR